jgi:hypothetical protein
MVGENIIDPWLFTNYQKKTAEQQAKMKTSKVDKET